MNNALKKFRTMDGSERRAAMRAYLQKEHAIVFDQSHESLTATEQRALHDMAKAVSWRKGSASILSLQAAFYVYLSRDLAKPVHAAMVAHSAVTRPRRALVYGRGIS